MFGGLGEGAAAPVGVVEEGGAGDEGDGAFGPEADWGRGVVGVGDGEKMFDFEAGFGGVVAADRVAHDEVEEAEKILGLGALGRSGEAEVEFAVRLLREHEVPIIDGLDGIGVGGPFLDVVAGRLVRRSQKSQF